MKTPILRVSETRRSRAAVKGEERREIGKKITLKSNKHNYYYGMWLLTFFRHFFLISALAFVTLLML